MVEATAYWDGPPGKFFDAISRPGHFLDEVAPGHWAIHNWLKHAPDFVRKRVKKLEEMNPDLAAENWWKGEAFALAVVGRTVIFPVKSRPPADEGGGRAENGGLRQPPAAIGSYRQPRVGVRDSEEALLPSPSSTLRNFGPVETAEKARQEADEIPVLIRRVSSVVVELTQLGRGGEVEAIEELMEGALSRAEWASLADQAEEILAAYAPAAAVIS
ncbi:MAG: hypothetical protein ABI639_14485 [Thermoanaerobaculia bacterium]